MLFGQVLELCKKGVKITRKGWNGKNMFVVYQKAYPQGIPLNENTAQTLGLHLGTVVKFRPYLMMYTSHGECVPWVASQSDILAEDWDIFVKNQ